jgi:hypothetical protein
MNYAEKHCVLLDFDYGIEFMRVATVGVEHQRKDSVFVFTVDAV